MAALGPQTSRRRGGRRSPIPAAAIAVVLAVAAAGCGSSGAGTSSSSHTSTTRGAARAASHAGTVISVHSSGYGRILSAGDNRTVYLFTRDRGRASNCSGACAAAWPPVLTRGAPRPGQGLAAALGTTRRSDGTRQVTYAGHPLYYYVGDRRPGQILCQDVVEFGGTWLVVSPHGRPVR